MRSSTSARAALVISLGTGLLAAGAACVNREKRLRAEKRSDTHLALAQPSER